MDLKALEAQWNELGRVDPMWAVMSWPDKLGGRWNADEFFLTGRSEIDSLMTHVAGLGRPVEGGRALDFGSGLGRLSQALARYFDQVDGVDIAPSMVEKACAFNAFGERVKYHLNQQNDLALFPKDSFDFIYSSITLQHMSPSYAQGYLREFIRVLKPGGTIVFQIPSHPAWTLKGMLWRFLPYSVVGFLLRLKNKTAVNMEMHGVSRSSVTKLASAEGARVIDCKSNGDATSDWVSFLYTVTK